MSLTHSPPQFHHPFKIKQGWRMTAYTSGGIWWWTVSSAPSVCLLRQSACSVSLSAAALVVETQLFVSQVFSRLLGSSSYIPGIFSHILSQPLDFPDLRVIQDSFFPPNSSNVHIFEMLKQVTEKDPWDYPCTSWNVLERQQWSLQFMWLEASGCDTMQKWMLLYFSIFWFTI